MFSEKVILALAILVSSTTLNASQLWKVNSAPVERVHRAGDKLMVALEGETEDNNWLVLQGSKSDIDFCEKVALISLTDPNTFAFGIGRLQRRAFKGDLSNVKIGGDQECWIARKVKAQAH